MNGVYKHGWQKIISVIQSYKTGRPIYKVGYEWNKDKKLLYSHCIPNQFINYTFHLHVKKLHGIFIQNTPKQDGIASMSP